MDTRSILRPATRTQEFDRASHPACDQFFSLVRSERANRNLVGWVDRPSVLDVFLERFLAENSMFVVKKILFWARLVLIGRGDNDPSSWLDR